MEEWYSVTPYIVEERGNLKSLGIQAPMKITNINDIMVVHIKDNLPLNDTADLTEKMRQYFGNSTLVFCFNKDINFYNIRKCDDKEVEYLKKHGFPIFIEEVDDIGPEQSEDN